LHRTRGSAALTNRVLRIAGDPREGSWVDGLVMGLQLDRGRVSRLGVAGSLCMETCEGSVRAWWWLAFVLGLCLAPLSLAQLPSGSLAQADARAEVATALYAASATQAAAERVADAKIRAQRREIDELRAQVRAGAAPLKAALTAAEERYVATLAARDRTYGQEIAVFRAAVEDIASTPEGVAALARFNAGDEIGALAVLDDLRAARDAARKKRAAIESAAEGRRIATLALEARAKGKQTTAHVIARYEEVTRLDPGVPWDWIELGRLYRDAGRLADALRAAKAAVDTAQDERLRAVAFDAVGDVQVAQGNLAAALESYRSAYAIFERLTKADSANILWQNDLAVSYSKIGDVQLTQGNRAAALESYQASKEILKRLTKADPGGAGWLRHLSVSYDRIGYVHQKQGDLQAALESYGASLAIAERLANDDPGNAQRQRDLAVSYSQIGDVQVAQSDLPAALDTYLASLAIAERLAKADPGNAEWQRDLSALFSRIGDVQVAQRNLPAALENYRASLAIAERLAKAEPGNAGWQSDLAVSYRNIGDVQRAQRNLPAALESYRASLAIAERLAKADPDNAAWQRNLIVSYLKLSAASGDDKAYVAKALDVALAMQQRGMLEPRDARLIEDLKRLAGR